MEASLEPRAEMIEYFWFGLRCDDLVLCISACSAALRPVASELCLDLPPNTTQLCHISCPVECEVSAWSAWGPCTYENCQDQSTKKGDDPLVQNVIGT